MSIKNYNFKFVFTAENNSNICPIDHEIMIRIKATLIFPDLAGDYVNINYILEAFEKIGFSNPVFMYDKISSSKDITLSEFMRDWEPDDPFGLQLTYYRDRGYLFNLHSPRDVIPKKR